MAKKVTERVIEIDAKGAENSIRALREEVRKLTEVQKDLDMESEEFRDISSELTAAQTKLRNAVQGNTAAVEGSYKAYSHQLQVLKEHRKWLAEGTEEYRKATEEISKLDQKLKDMDAEIGVYSRNVGNYASAFEGLNGGVQQVAQGIPQLVDGSQNLFGIARSSIPTILKSAESIGEVSNQGGKAKAVISALTKSIFSWKTALVAGVAILAEYGGKIVDWVSGLNKAEKQLTTAEKAMREVEGAMQDTVKGLGENIFKLRELKDEWDGLGDNMSAKEAFIRTNQSAFEDLGLAISNTVQAEKFFAEQTDEFIEAMKLRAKAAAATKLAESKYEDILVAEEELKTIPQYETQHNYISLGGEIVDMELQIPNRAYSQKRQYIEDLEDQIDALYNIKKQLESEAAKFEKEYSAGGSFESFLAQWYGVSPEKIAQARAAAQRRSSGSTRKRLTVDNAISTLGAYSNRGIAITALGGLAIDEGASIEANKARLAALTQMEGASAEERKAIEQSLQDELAFIEQMRLETHEMVLNEMLRSDELTADERIALEEELTANQVAQAELRAKAAEEQAKAEKKAAEEVMAIEKKKQEVKKQMAQQAAAILRNSAELFEENTIAYKGLNAAAIALDTITGAVAGYKAGMAASTEIGGVAATALAWLNLTSTLTMGAVQLKNLLAVKPDGSNADSALSSAQVPNVASSMPASYTRNLMGDNELSELNKDTRVYVVEQDITDTQNKAKTREESASF